MARILVFDPSPPGLRKVLREHEELALRYFWEERNESTRAHQEECFIL